MKQIHFFFFCFHLLKTQKNCTTDTKYQGLFGNGLMFLPNVAYLKPKNKSIEKPIPVRIYFGFQNTKTESLPTESFEIRFLENLFQGVNLRVNLLLIIMS